MSIFTIMTSDLNSRARVAAFQETVSTLCRLEFSPDNAETFCSATSIGVLP